MKCVINSTANNAQPDEMMYLLEFMKELLGPTGSLNQTKRQDNAY